MTPYQLNLYLYEYYEQKRAAEKEKLILTYLGAYWQRVKKFPSLNSILREPPKKMTDEEMLAKVKMLNAALGGAVKE